MRNDRHCLFRNEALSLSKYHNMFLEQIQNPYGSLIEETALDRITGNVACTVPCFYLAAFPCPKHCAHLAL